MLRPYTGAVFLAAVALYLVLALSQIGRPLTYDEVDFAKAARAIAGGSFLYDRGYIADYPWNPEHGLRLQYALYHPPGYLLALAAWQRVAGAGDAALRAFGVLAGLASLAGAAALGRFAGGPRAGVLAALLWATSPYAIQSALLLDIDGTVLAPATAAFVWLALRTGRDEGRRTKDGGRRLRSGAALSAAFALALWCKLTTPLIVAAALVLWLTLQRRRPQARRLAVACIAGSLVLLVSWLLVAWGTGLPAVQPFRDVWYEALDTAGLTGNAATGPAAGVGLAALRTLVAALRSMQWLHPLLVGLLVAAPLALRRDEPAAALLFVTAVTMAVYLSKMAAGFPKYHAGVLPLAAAVAGVAAARWLDAALPTAIRLLNEGRTTKDEIGASVGGASVNRYSSFAKTNWFLPAGIAVGFAAGTATGADALIRHADLRLLAAWLAVAAGCLALARFAGPTRAGALAVGLLLGANVSAAARQAATVESTTYFYGSSGQFEAAAWLRSVAARGELVAADREVAYYAAPVHFVDSERLIAPTIVAPGITGFPSPAGVPAVGVVVSRHAQVAAHLPAGTTPAGRFGEYRAWVIRRDPS
ncbi:MAG: glycosyltransferase family 39 protein [Chloroflexi bacterium]|nr:glycosyltransferase family 39 protein [Chloroflexota bacterium]